MAITQFGKHGHRGTAPAQKKPDKPDEKQPAPEDQEAEKKD